MLERELLGSMRPTGVRHGRVVRLESGARFARWLESEHEDHALAVYRQGRERSYSERATMALLAQATGNRFFHELRTEREIGYIVFATLLPVLEVPGLALVIQSPSTPPEALHRQVDAFIRRFAGALRDMPPAVFERHRAAVESSLLEAESRLDDRTERYWGEIDREHYEFDRRERLVEAVLHAVDRDELADRLARPLRCPGDRKGGGGRGLRRSSSRVRPGVSRRGAGDPTRRRSSAGNATSTRIATLRKIRVAEAVAPAR